MFSLCQYEWLWVLCTFFYFSICLSYSQPTQTLLYTLNVNVETPQSKGTAKLRLLAGEEPVDVVERFSRNYNLDTSARSLILDHLCEAVRCKRKVAKDALFTVSAGWKQKSECSMKLSIVEDDKFDLIGLIDHHCNNMKLHIYGCECPFDAKSMLYRRISREFEKYIWSEASLPHMRLGIHRDADEHTIRKAYRKLSRFYHPDRNKARNAEKKFILVSNAYEEMVSLLKQPKQHQNVPNNGIPAWVLQMFGPNVVIVKDTYGNMHIRF